MTNFLLNHADGVADMAVEANDLAADDSLETAVFDSLFTWRRADPTDVLPSGQTSRRGWWGDAAGEDLQDRWGSKLWLLEREKQTEETRLRYIEYCEQALAWLVEGRIAESVTVDASYPERGVILIAVEILRPERERIEYRYNINWDAQELRVGKA